MTRPPVELRAEPPGRRRGYWMQAFRRLLREPAALASVVVLAALLLIGALAGRIEPEGWNRIDLSGQWLNHAPTLAGGHLLGTDQIGRDVLARTVWGLQTTEQTALVGALLATLLGVGVGALAGLRGGWLDTGLMRAADLVTGFPTIVVLIVCFVWLRPVTVWEATLVFSLTLWTFVARVVRARVAGLATQEFVLAARGLGASERRVFFRHVLPNSTGTVIVAATALVGQIVLVEATSEFFGYGVASVRRPTLGNLIAETTREGIGPNALGIGWWVWVVPCAVLVLLLGCVNVAGDGLQAALDPRTRRH